MPASIVRRNLADAINRVRYGGERIYLCRRGKPIAAIVSIEDAEFLERAEVDIDNRMADEALARGKFISWEDAEKEFDRDDEEALRDRD